MAFDATAVYAGRSMIMYSAPYATTNAFPALTVLYGTAWGVPWVDRGYTQEGAEWEITHDFADIEVDQELSSVLTVPSGQTAVMRTNLAEFKMDNIALATGQGSVVTVAAGPARGSVTYNLTGEISDNLSSWGMDFRKNSNGEAMRAAIWRGKSIGSMAATFGVADANPRVPVEVRGYPDTAGTPARRIMSVQDVLPIVV